MVVFGEEVFHHQGMNSAIINLVVFCGLSGLLVSLSLPLDFSSSMYQIVDLTIPSVFPISLMVLLHLSQMITLYRHVFGCDIESFIEHLPNAGSALGILDPLSA